MKRLCYVVEWAIKKTPLKWNRPPERFLFSRAAADEEAKTYNEDNVMSRIIEIRTEETVIEEYNTSNLGK